MRESFLHFIWQFQKFEALDLETSEGLKVQVFSIGEYNTDAGPDFLNAKVQIGKITWYGNVEIHINSSDWESHSHQNDEAYNNVILHVVWSNDRLVHKLNGADLPVIELKNRVNQKLLKRCDELLKSPEKIPCQNIIHQVKKIDIIANLEKMGIARLENKSSSILDLLRENNGSWEETTYQLLAKNFGFKTNEEPFLRLTKILPFRLISKVVNNPIQVESLIFGVAGFLPLESQDPWVMQLISEFRFLSKKYGLINQCLLKVEWKFLRMRPGNFPTVRLSQFASFLCANPNFFQLFIGFTKNQEVVKMFTNKPSEYWANNYDFDKPSKRKKSGMGIQSIEVMIINTVVPLLAAYGLQTSNDNYMEKATDLLMELKSEKNKIIEEWATIDIESKNAFDSQALIGLRNDFCLKNKCLSCKIGVSLINR
ncbi:MAG: DUF2851 family protein [Reichenbachiella sp.]